MHPLVCSKFLEDYLLVNRMNFQAVKIPQALYRYLWENQKAGASSETPAAIQTLLGKVGFKLTPSVQLYEYLLVRPIPLLAFGKASYEVTESCNYRCRHCILAHRHRQNLPLDKRYRLLDFIADAGCLWLQLTGGEATIDKYFVETYQYAYAKVFLINLSTNGSRLSQPRIRELLAQMPPYRMAISMYGGTQESFAALTQDEDGYGEFLAGLQTALHSR